MTTDHNSSEAWDAIWKKDGGVSTWRVYPRAFSLVCNIVGHSKKVVDVGCGVGILAARLKAVGNSVYGIDISGWAIYEMKINFEIDGIVHDMRKPVPCETGAFDWCVATEFLEHFLPEEVDGVVAEIARIGRNAVFCVPNGVLPHSECKEHNNVFTPESLKELLLRHYKVVHIAGFLDEFDSGKFKDGNPVEISLPTLIARCSQEEIK